MNNKILIVDDEKKMRDSLSDILSFKGYKTIKAKNGEETMNIIVNDVVDLILLDIKMPGMDGIKTLREIKKIEPHLPVIMISGYGTIRDAVEATKLGAYDYIEKPVEAERLFLTVQNALERSLLQLENIRLQEDISKKYFMVGNSKAIKKIHLLIKKAAPTNAKVMIIGENGTGKELIAKAIHNNSRRAGGPFVRVNCASIPEELIESELFGHKKGAFTGAYTDKDGKFFLADKGTIFLDEIGDMSLRTQSKVLRVLQEGEFERVGDTEIINVDVRVISATNKNLYKEIREKKFREDLFYRLNVITITVPPLRKRKEDIPMLAEYFLKEFTEENNKDIKGFTKSALKALIDSPWRGNIRELRNVIERIVILSDKEFIDSSDVFNALSLYMPDEKKPSSTVYKEAHREFEKKFIVNNLIANNWNISKTAESISIDRTTLYKKMKKLGIKAK
ncbi:sigma-54-dependent Fis family transcriptional regulator [candidate division KSB1 bacterium]|nr:MAG: sigma-54-dependent Fis family transcriptional regulator [candidate division KSB1 bacterium]